MRPRIDDAVPDIIVSKLLKKFPDFERAYDENRLAGEEFDSFGPTRRTLRQFIQACHDLDALVLDSLVPNPDLTVA